MHSAEEVELARRLLAGDMDAFDGFVDVFRSRVFQYSFLMCRHREDAEEVAQETLLKVFESFDQLKEPERVRPWVLRIARNACLMKRRRGVFAPQHEVSLEELLPMSRLEDGGRRMEIADWSALPDEQAMHSEMKEALDSAIAELPDIYRSVILLRDVEELSTAETAQILDLSQDVVKQRLHRARLLVRQRLDAFLRRAA